MVRRTKPEDARTVAVKLLAFAALPRRLPRQEHESSRVSASLWRTALSHPPWCTAPSKVFRPRRSQALTNPRCAPVHQARARLPSPCDIASCWRQKEETGARCLTWLRSHRTGPVQLDYVRIVFSPPRPAARSSVPRSIVDRPLSSAVLLSSDCFPRSRSPRRQGGQYRKWGLGSNRTEKAVKK